MAWGKDREKISTEIEVKFTRKGKWHVSTSQLGGPDLCTYDMDSGQMIYRMREVQHYRTGPDTYQEIRVNGPACDRQFFDKIGKTAGGKNPH